MAALSTTAGEGGPLVHEDRDGNRAPGIVQHGGLLPMDKHSMTQNCREKCEALRRWNMPHAPLPSFIFQELQNNTHGLSIAVTL